MFQRLKGFNLDAFLDGKIAEEEAKKAQEAGASAQLSPHVSARGTASRASSRTGTGVAASPSRRGTSRLRAPDEGVGVSFRAPDPDDFVIGDDVSVSDISRAGTPLPKTEGLNAGAVEEEQSKAGRLTTMSPEKRATPSQISPAVDKAAPGDKRLPEDVHKKLAKLESLTTKYQGMSRD